MAAGPISFSGGQLALWSLALAFLGVFCAVPLRTQTILKEKLRFPSGVQPVRHTSLTLNRMLASV